MPDTPVPSNKNYSSNKGGGSGSGGGGEGRNSPKSGSESGGKNSPKSGGKNSPIKSHLSNHKGSRDANEGSNLDISPLIPTIAVPQSSSKSTTSQRNGQGHGLSGKDGGSVGGGSSQKSRTRASFLSLEGIRNVIGDAIEGMTMGSSRQASYRSGGGSGRDNDDDSSKGDDEGDSSNHGPKRRVSILQALPQLFGGWRGDKSQKSKSFRSGGHSPSNMRDDG